MRAPPCHVPRPLASPDGLVLQRALLTLGSPLALLVAEKPTACPATSPTPSRRVHFVIRESCWQVGQVCVHSSPTFRLCHPASFISINKSGNSIQSIHSMDSLQPLVSQVNTAPVLVNSSITFQTIPADTSR